MKKVRLNAQNIAVEVFDQLPPLHPALADQFIDAPDNVEEGMEYKDSVFSVPVIPLAKRKKQHAAALRGECKRRIFDVTDAEDQLNGLRRSIQLERKRRQGGTLTAKQLAEEAQLIRLGDWIDEMRAARKAATADSTPVDDVVWPEL